MDIDLGGIQASIMDAQEQARQVLLNTPRPQDPEEERLYTLMADSVSEVLDLLQRAQHALMYGPTFESELASSRDASDLTGEALQEIFASIEVAETPEGELRRPPNFRTTRPSDATAKWMENLDCIE